ncbi:hypothetical protein, partial [Jannaschia aquimarina]|uniref:hypothetical protein n=1 Tax=Jannaschia aquimarina TaxID=935700 RepID=UPI001F41D854
MRRTDRTPKMPAAHAVTDRAVTGLRGGPPPHAAETAHIPTSSRPRPKARACFFSAQILPPEARIGRGSMPR